VYTIIRSLVITSLISATIAGTFWSLDQTFIKPFILSFILQFIGFWLFNTCAEYFYSIKARQLENDRIIEFSKQGISVNCAYCSTENLIPVRFDDNNDFLCTNCDKNNAVYIGVTVTQKTSPLNVNPLMINTVNSDEQQAIDRLSHE